MKVSTRKLMVISAFLFMTVLLSLQLVFVQQASASPTAKMNVDPASQSVSSSFTINITVTDVVDLYAWEFRLNYSTSIITSTSVTEGPLLQNGTDNIIWHGDDGEVVYKTNTADPSISVGSWSYTACAKGMLGIEYVNGFIYFVDYGDDLLYNMTVDGTYNAAYDISGFSGDAYGLGWNGTHFLIADRGDDFIYFVDPANPTTSVKQIAYSGIGTVEGVTFDGTYIWASDTSTDLVYKLNAATGATQSSFSTSSETGDPVGITWDGTNLYVVGSDQTFKYATDGTLLASYGTPGSACEGLTFAAIPPSSPRTTNFFVKENSDANGRVWASNTLQGDTAGLKGSGVIATISFSIDSSGTSNLDLHKTRLVGYNYTSKTTFRIIHAPNDGSVTTSVGVPEFPLGAAAEIGIVAVVIYVWWRKRKPKLNTSLTSPR